MKKYFILLFSSFLILSACDNDFSLTGDNKKNRMIPTIKKRKKISIFQNQIRIL